MKLAIIHKQHDLQKGMNLSISDRRSIRFA